MYDLTPLLLHSDQLHTSRSKTTRLALADLCPFSCRDTMQDLLFCYAKEHPEVSYRQGMHELLAPVLFVLHSEMRDVNNDPSLA